MAIENTNRGVPELEHYTNFDWNDVRLFVLIAQSGSLRRASTKTNRSINSIRRRINHLENRIGAKLLVRDSAGSHLTDMGKDFLAASQRMFDASFDVASVISRTDQSIEGKVKIGVTEGLGTFWIVPQLVDFQKTHPNILVDLECTMVPTDVYALQSDLSVQLDAPVNNELIVTKLGYLHMQLFASEDFIRQYGSPESLNDLHKFKFVEQVSPQVPHTNRTTMLPNFPDEMIAVRTNTSSSHAYAISKGAGIGVLPTYARAVTKRVVPILGEAHFRREIYLTYKRDIGQQKHTRAAIDWLKSAFDPVRYPWFSERFVAPGEFEDHFKQDNVVHLFEGFSYN